jgi:methanogenic corrinoid protein MtbC1
MKELFTPRQVARAIQVSESSVKRWCDKGSIPTQYTAGGHRRIPIGGLLAFLRSNRHAIVRPELLGLPAATGQTHRVIDRALDQFTEALVRGDEEFCRQVILDLYLAEHQVSVICDQVLARSFTELGNRWACGTIEVFQERRGCEIALRLLRELRSFLPVPQVDWPTAIGGTATGDPYLLATATVELVLRDAGWNAVSLGSNLPFSTLAAAIEQQKPRLFWLSISCIENEDEFVRGCNELHERFSAQTAFVLGGRALTESVARRIRCSGFCDNLHQLESFAAASAAAIAAPVTSAGPVADGLSDAPVADAF